MIEHVYRRSAMCKALDAVFIATCDAEIARATEAFGGKAIMTSPAHERASDRMAEVAGRIDAEIFVLVQGDEPMIVPEMIDLAVGPLLNDETVHCTNLASPILSPEEFEDPNTIKVVMANNGDALYFSREPIPARRQKGLQGLPAWKQVCIIPFRRDFLHLYTGLPPTPLEQAESIDMLRLLEHGHPVRLVKCDHPTHAVDTPGDLALVEKLMAGDPLVAAYESVAG
jgi:3-deoxy-manno-octulosonate cytidylyltransferase (CMP-KDO synthetase)